MKIFYFIILTILNFQFVYCQKENTERIKSNFEFKTGYSSFDKNFNGGHFTAGYNYNFNEYFLGQASASFDFGKNLKKGDTSQDTYKSGTVLIGVKGEYPLFKRNKLRAGPDVGIMLLNLDRNDITDDPLLFPIVYGFSVSYLIEINERMEIGLSFSQQYMNKLDFTNQRFGLLLILN